MRNLFLILIIGVFLFGCSEQDSVFHKDSPKENKSNLTDDEINVLAYAFNNSHTVNIDDAQQKAEEAMASFLTQETNGLKSGKSIPKITKIQVIKTPKSLTKSFSDTEFDVVLPDTVAYLFSFGTNNGYAMIAADERIAEPILACTDVGEIPDEVIEDEPLGFFLDNAGEYIVKQLEIAQQKQDSLISSITEKLKAEMPEELIPEENEEKTKSFIGNIIFSVSTSTKAGSWRVINSKGYYVPVEWGQGSPYWNLVKDKKKCGTVRTGCVATAVAQIIAYWKYPSNIDGVNFDWNGLTGKTYVSAWQNNEANLRYQVAHLMKRIGENSGMDYGCSSSGTKTYKGRNYMNRLGYSGGGESKYNFNIVMSSLNAARPVLARGDRTFKYIKIFGKKIGYTTNGHAWIIDGYIQKTRPVEQTIIIRHRKTGKIIKIETRRFNETSSFIHNNWGWDGSHNGWFAEGCFDSHNGEVSNPMATKSEGNSLSDEYDGDEYDFDSGSDGNYRYNNKIYSHLAPKK